MPNLSLILSNDPPNQLSNLLLHASASSRTKLPPTYGVQRDQGSREHEN
jgi:hypothetical protein